MMTRRIEQAGIIVVCFSVLMLLGGCNEEHTQKAPTDKTADELLQQAEPEQHEHPVEHPATQDTLSEKDENTEAEQKMAFARSRFSMAQKGLMGYSQTVVLCRDVIKNYPGTSYERQAQMLLRQVPEEQRSQFNITDKELGL